MKHTEEYKTTDNNSVWKKLHKWIYAKCSRCKWNRNENANHHSKFGKKKGHHNTLGINKSEEDAIDRFF